MYLKNINISNFRNIISFESEFHPKVNLIFGDNAQGKSNLLESLYMLAFLKSTRTNALPDLVTLGKTRASIETELVDNYVHRRIRLNLEDRKRNIFLDAMPVNTLNQYLGILRVILFQPSDVSLLRSTPLERRSVLDKMLFNVRPLYIMDVKQYQGLIKRKSALLREDRPDFKTLDVFDEEIIKVGVRIVRDRVRFFNALFPNFEEIFSAIFGSSFNVSMKYKCSGVGELELSHDRQLDVERCAENFVQAAMGARERELLQRQVIIGPHRDDWSVYLNGTSARLFASQGQQRSIILALKMAEIQFLKNYLNVEPLLLLDDISSELDEVRSRQLFEFLGKFTAQVFLTTTARKYIPFKGDCMGFRVCGGVIERVE